MNTLANLLACSLGFLPVVMILRRLQKPKPLDHQSPNADCSQEFTNEVLRSQLEIREQSIRYFTNEIHDNVGQSLSAVGIHLYQLKTECGQERTQSLLGESTMLLNKAINDLRGFTHTMDAKELCRSGLAAALERELAYLSTTSGCRCTLTIAGEAEEFGSGRLIILFRIVQQAMVHAICSTKASEIDISLIYEPGRLTASLCSNKALWEETLAVLPFVDGRRILQRRAKVLQAELKLNEKSGNKYFLTITLPIHPGA